MRISRTICRTGGRDAASRSATKKGLTSVGWLHRGLSLIADSRHRGHSRLFRPGRRRPGRRDRQTVEDDRRVGEALRGNITDLRRGDRLPAGEGVARHGGRETAIAIVAIGVADCLARREREPGDRRHRAEIAGPAQPDPGSSEKRDDGGAVIGDCEPLAWDPGPAVAKPRPASEMRRGEAPRRVVDPRPAPRRDIAPGAVAVGHPIGGDVAREPDIAELRIELPAAGVAEGGEARNFRPRPRVAAVGGVALRAPPIAEPSRGSRRRCEYRRARRQTAPHRQRNLYRGRRMGVASSYVVVARCGKPDAALRQVDFDRLRRAASVEMNAGASGGQRDLQRCAIEPQHLQLARRR